MRYLAFKIELHLFTTLDNTIPDNHLIDIILCSFILGENVDEKLLIIPVKELCQVGFKVKVEIAQILSIDKNLSRFDTCVIIKDYKVRFFLFLFSDFSLRVNVIRVDSQ